MAKKKTTNTASLISALGSKVASSLGITPEKQQAVRDAAARVKATQPSGTGTVTQVMGTAPAAQMPSAPKAPVASTPAVSSTPSPGIGTAPKATAPIAISQKATMVTPEPAAPVAPAAPVLETVKPQIVTVQSEPVARERLAPIPEPEPVKRAPAIDVMSFDEFKNTGFWDSAGIASLQELLANYNLTSDEAREQAVAMYKPEYDLQKLELQNRLAEITTSRDRDVTKLNSQYDKTLNSIMAGLNARHMGRSSLTATRGVETENARNAAVSDLSYEYLQKQNEVNANIRQADSVYAQSVENKALSLKREQEAQRLQLLTQIAQLQQNGYTAYANYLTSLEGLDVDQQRLENERYQYQLNQQKLDNEKLSYENDLKRLENERYQSSLKEKELDNQKAAYQNDVKRLDNETYQSTLKEKELENQKAGFENDKLKLENEKKSLKNEKAKLENEKYRYSLEKKK